MSTAIKSKTTTFSRIFHPQKIDNFLGKSKLNFWTKNEDLEQCVFLHIGYCLVVTANAVNLSIVRFKEKWRKKYSFSGWQTEEEISPYSNVLASQSLIIIHFTSRHKRRKRHTYLSEQKGKVIGNVLSSGKWVGKHMWIVEALWHINATFKNKQTKYEA